MLPAAAAGPFTKKKSIIKGIFFLPATLSIIAVGSWSFGLKKAGLPEAIFPLVPICFQRFLHEPTFLYLHGPS